MDPHYRPRAHRDYTHSLDEPSRILYVGNVDARNDDVHLQSLFLAYGPIRKFVAKYKSNGFVCVFYYDTRQAIAAVRDLQGTVLFNKPLWIYYAHAAGIPPSHELNQGIIKVRNADPDMSATDVHAVFAPYGNIFAIRQVANDPSVKFVDFYDMRVAASALTALDGAEFGDRVLQLEYALPVENAAAELLFQDNFEESEYGASFDEPTNSQDHGLLAMPPQAYGAAAYGGYEGYDGNEGYPTYDGYNGYQGYEGQEGYESYPYTYPSAAVPTPPYPTYPAYPPQLPPYALRPGGLFVPSGNHSIAAVPSPFSMPSMPGFISARPSYAIPIETPPPGMPPNGYGMAAYAYNGGMNGFYARRDPGSVPPPAGARPDAKPAAPPPKPPELQSLSAFPPLASAVGPSKPSAAVLAAEPRHAAARPTLSTPSAAAPSAQSDSPRDPSDRAGSVSDGPESAEAGALFSAAASSATPVPPAPTPDAPAAVAPITVSTAALFGRPWTKASAAASANVPRSVPSAAPARPNGSDVVAAVRDVSALADAAPVPATVGSPAPAKPVPASAAADQPSSAAASSGFLRSPSPAAADEPDVNGFLDILVSHSRASPRDAPVDESFVDSLMQNLLLS